MVTSSSNYEPEVKLAYVAMIYRQFFCPGSPHSPVVACSNDTVTIEELCSGIAECSVEASALCEGKGK